MLHAVDTTPEAAATGAVSAPNGPGEFAGASDANGSLARLRRAIEHAAHLLPAQGPITTFIHHNTLHAFEDLPFTEAVEKAGGVFGCAPYLSEERYREALKRGRLSLGDLETVLREELAQHGDEVIVLGCTRRQLRLAMLRQPLHVAPTAELLWCVAETDALRRFSAGVAAADRTRMIAETRRWVMRDLRNGQGKPAAGRHEGKEAPAWAEGLLDEFGAATIEAWDEVAWEAFALLTLWRICCHGVAAVPEADAPPRGTQRHRDLLVRVARVDTDALVHEVLIRFCAAFLDQGLAHWQLPGRDAGFYRSFIELHRQRWGPPTPWRRDLAGTLADLANRQVSALEAIHESLEWLGVPEGEWQEFLGGTLLALRGWAGMIDQVERRADRVVHAIPEGSLIDFLAVRLVLERMALAHAAGDALGYRGPLRDLRAELLRRMPPARSAGPEQRAFLIFQLAQVLAWTPESLGRLDASDWRCLVHDVEAFSAVHRRRVFHLAFEKHFYAAALDAIALHNVRPRGEPRAPRFQAMFCIDEREESLRRHVEEVAPDAVTFGIAGFYFVDMYYKGLADAHFVPLCPPVIRPRHWVVEAAAEDLTQAHQRRAQARQALGKATHHFHVGSRTLFLGALLSAAVGVLASAPLIARTLFPRLTARLRKLFGWLVRLPRQTRLDLEHGAGGAASSEAETPSASEPQAQPGFTLDAMAEVAERVLRDTGLTRGFARLVLTLGHGSTSQNNPHESAHDCGACGGGQGGANGRAIAQILNDPRVRARLETRGIVIPAETVFVGGMHNTSSEQLTFFDLDRLPESHREEFQGVRDVMEEACDRDAHERCRRFESAPLGLTFAAARVHVEARAEDLAQVRPEWGHATNAICVVARRCRTRGLFLDRRAFLNSYDPAQDDAEATILSRILQAAMPVCAGISLEYYFSFVDNKGYGCDTKLPHNVTALLGVMDGAASDLRTGLPWQMVEIHEPVRILFVIETTPEKMLRIMERQAGIDRLVRNGWVKLALLDPDSAEVRVFAAGAFQPYQPRAGALPTATSSLDWYRGWRDHLEFAAILAAGA